MTEEEYKAEAAESWLCFNADLEAGFTEEQAMQVLCRPWVTIKQIPANYPPEMYEFWERQNAFATKALKELDE